MQRVKARVSFYDMAEHCQRTAGDEFDVSEERADYLRAVTLAVYVDKPKRTRKAKKEA